jgi:3-oxo-5-alpha-steroid 4-dehydrogenase 1
VVNLLPTVGVILFAIGMAGNIYSETHPARQAELNQLKTMAKDMMTAWIGDMLGAEKKGEQPAAKVHLLALRWSISSPPWA